MLGAQAITPSVLANGVLHAPLQVCARQVVLADIHVGHSRVLQLLGEGFPGLQADLEVFAGIERPDAALLQDLHQPQQLLVKHALSRLQQAGWTHLKLCQNVAIPMTVSYTIRQT